MIYLPIPESITDSNGVTWGEDRLNGFAAAGLGIASDMIKSDNIAEAIKAGATRTKESVGKLLGDQNTINATNSVLQLLQSMHLVVQQCNRCLASNQVQS